MTPRRSALATVGGVSAAVVVVALPPFLIGSISPRIRTDFGFDAAELGLAIAGYFLVSGVCSPAGGRVADRFGATASLRVACLATAVGLVWISQADSAVDVLIGLTFIGLPNALVQPATNEVLARIDSPRAKAGAFGLAQAAIPSATLTAGLLLPVSYGIDWPLVVLGVAVLTAAVSLVVPAVPHVVRRRTVHADAPPPAPLGGPSLMVGLVLIGLCASIASTSLPSFISTTGLAWGLSPLVVAGAQVAGSLSSVVVRIAVPIVASRHPLERRIAIIAAMLALGVGGFALLGTGTSTGFVVGTVVAYACGWGWNGLFNLVVSGVRPDGISRATGFTQGGVYIGGTAGPLLFAAVAQANGYATGWLTLAGCASLAFFAALYAGRRVRRSAMTHHLAAKPPTEVLTTCH